MLNFDAFPHYYYDKSAKFCGKGRRWLLKPGAGLPGLTVAGAGTRSPMQVRRLAISGAVVDLSGW
jgi:hypothetical protein